MFTTGPFFPESGELFSVFFDMDVIQMWCDKRVNMREIALYRVRDSQIIEENFVFPPDEV